MHSTIFTTVALLAASAVSYPTQKPVDIADVAGGTVPNGPPPKNISQTAVTFFQNVNFLENLEAAFFEEGLQNLTAWNKHHKLDTVIEVVAKVQAQEVIHTQTATTVLQLFNKPTFLPCKYSFPVSDVEQFLLLANTITSAGIGFVINGAATLALTDPGLVQGPASIVGAEARHDAFFRLSALHVVPNPAPFDTRISAPYALNLASQFIVPGSCPSGMPSFPVIPALTADVPQDQLVTGTGGQITFSFDATAVDIKNGGEGLSIGWVNQNNKFQFTEARFGADSGKVETDIPEGLASAAFAVLTSGKDAADVNALTKITVAGPAVVQIS
ncbi:MAG: hypothetical protein Q9190_003823 [Brigantiaea leucoxantha]